MEYIYILKLLLKTIYYNKYINYINIDSIKKASKDLYRIYYVLKEIQTKENKDYSLEDLKLSYLIYYPPELDEVTSLLFHKIETSSVDPSIIEGYLDSIKKYEAAYQIIDAATAVVQGSGELERVQEVLTHSLEQKIASTRVLGLSLTEEDTDYGPGIYWRLQCLNVSLGPLRIGNFGFIFARPETGKTTFLSSEATNWISQVKRPILWFNNEQSQREVEGRIIQSFHNITTKQFLSNPKEYLKSYNEIAQNKLTVVDAVSLPRKEIEAWLKDVNPEAIIFDQLDKVQGFHYGKEERKDLEYKSIYQWTRELAKTYGPTIGVCQAGGTGEGRRYLTMDDVDGSKTSKQGEADWIIGIGMEHGAGYEKIRGISLCKNKLPGDINTLEKYRHAQLDVMIDPEKGRYYDVSTWSK